MSNSYISIFVKEMRVNVRVGLLPAEKVSPQPLDVSVELFVAPSYLQSDEIVDYAIIHKAIKAWENREHVELLETLMQELLSLGFGFEAVEAVRVSLGKPVIFQETNAAGVSAYIRREDFRC